jgi:hypothetical protein
METVYKYQLRTIDEQSIEMPLGAEVLALQIQNGVPCIWARVNPKHSKIRYRFKIFGTGQLIEDDFVGKYIGTYQIKNSALIFHVWQVN